MKSTPLILIGGGGHCVSCIDVIESSGECVIHGILDRSDKMNKKILRYRIIGTDDDIPRFISEKFSFLITIGFVSDSKPRIIVFEKLLAHHAKMSTVVSSSAHVSRYAEMGIGTIVMHHAVVNAGAKIGNNVIINTGAVVEHGAIIGDHSHVSTGSFVNGDCTIGNSVFLGSNSVLGEGVSVADNVVIGAGSVVIRSIKEAGVYVGNPARKIR